MLENASLVIQAPHEFLNHHRCSRNQSCIRAQIGNLYFHAFRHPWNE